MSIQQSYREAAIRGANPVELVVRLYEQLIEDLRQAAIAIEHNDIQWRSNRITHAILVIGHLQSSLDFAQGGNVAQNLDTFYDTLRRNLLQVQFYPSKVALTQQITDLQALREAWIQVDRAERSSGAKPGASVPRHFASSAAEPDSDTGSAYMDRPHLDWQG